MQYKRFEDIPVWQDSKKFIHQIYLLINRKVEIRKDFTLADQLKRAAYSISLNIAEGFERSSNTEFANFLNISKGSAGEVRSILHIMRDNDFIDEIEFKKLYDDTENISNQLGGFRKFLLINKSRKK